MADNFAVLTANGTTTATFRATDVGGGILAMMSIPTNKSGTAMIGQAVMATSIPVAIASDQSVLPVAGTVTAVISGTVPVSGTITATLSGTSAFNLVQFGGANVSLGQAVMATSIPVAIASNQIVTASIAQGGNVAVVKGANTAPAASDPAFVVALSPNSLNPNGQTTMANSAPVVIAVNQSVIPVGGDIASGTANSGNPVQLGAVGHTAFPSAVGDGQRVSLIADKTGRLQALGATRVQKGSQTAAITTPAETTIINPINATTFADIYGLILANKGATATEVSIRYGTGSTIVTNFYVPAGDTRGFMVPVDSALPGSLTTANVSWTAQLAATASIDVTAFYVQNI